MVKSSTKSISGNTSAKSGRGKVKKQAAKALPSTSRKTAVKTANPDIDLAATIKLGPVLDLMAATTLKDELLDLAAISNGLIVNAADVEVVATPCVQVLVAAGQTVEERGQKFSIDETPPIMLSAFKDLGLASVLERWSTMK